MDDWKGVFAALGLFVLLIDQSLAQSQPALVPKKTIGSCAVVQTVATRTEMPIELRAGGSCETATSGARMCTVEVQPTGQDIVLDANDRDAVPQCMGMSGQDPCAYVRNGPLIFQVDDASDTIVPVRYRRAGSDDGCSPTKTRTTKYRRSSTWREVSADCGRPVRRS